MLKPEQFASIYRLLSGKWELAVVMALMAACSKPRIEELADELGAKPAALYRIMRPLILTGIITTEERALPESTRPYRVFGVHKSVSDWIKFGMEGLSHVRGEVQVPQPESRS